jgi:hypothetical protein
MSWLEIREGVYNIKTNEKMINSQSLIVKAEGAVSVLKKSMGRQH